MSMRVKDVLRFFDLKEKFNDRQHNKGCEFDSVKRKTEFQKTSSL